MSEEINKPDNKVGAVHQNKVELGLPLFLSSFVVRLGGRKIESEPVGSCARKE